MSEKSIVQLFDLADRVAIVTGAGAGIGLGIARRLAEAGAAVVVNDIDGSRAKAAAGRLRGRGYSSLETSSADVSTAKGAQALVDAAMARFGRVDILVNNAGIYPIAPFLDHSVELWDRVIDTNLRGAFLCAQAVARQFEKQGRGQAILNIASVVGMVGSGPSAAARRRARAHPRARGDRVPRIRGRRGPGRSRLLTTSRATIPSARSSSSCCARTATRSIFRLSPLPSGRASRAA